ncbi:MAG TPA: hypothetical protein VFA95_13400 [Gammaproteobacteria bacterium]|nr:hypothetical protein [Gammaproteobacteria bacterium]
MKRHNAAQSRNQLFERIQKQQATERAEVRRIVVDGSPAERQALAKRSRAGVGIVRFDPRRAFKRG